MLQKKVKWRGREILLTGVLTEHSAIDARKKAPMGYNIARGTCYMGHAVAHILGIKRQDTINLLGRNSTVERVLLEAGSKEDIRVYAHLHDVQEMLGMPGRINTIQALHCLCYGATLAELQEQIRRALPDTHVTELRNIAVARSEIRRMVEKHAGFIMAVVLVVCAAWVGLLSLLNVRERRREIGILRALGFDSTHIMALFLGRAALMGLLGAVVGFAVGTTLAQYFGPEIFKLTFSKIRPAYDLLMPLVLITPLIATLASFLPAAIAVTQDPAAILREE